MDRMVKDGMYDGKIEGLMTHDSDKEDSFKELGKGDNPKEGSGDLQEGICYDVWKLAADCSESDSSQEMFVDQEGKIGKGITGKIGNHNFDPKKEQELVDKISKFILDTKGAPSPDFPESMSRVGTANSSGSDIEKARADAKKMLTKLITKTMDKTITKNFKKNQVKNIEVATSVGSMETIGTDFGSVTSVPVKKKFVTRHWKWTFLAPKKKKVVKDPFEGVTEEYPQHVINNEEEGMTLIGDLLNYEKEVRTKKAKARKQREVMRKPQQNKIVTIAPKALAVAGFDLKAMGVKKANKLKPRHAESQTGFAFIIPNADDESDAEIDTLRE